MTTNPILLTLIPRHNAFSSSPKKPSGLMLAILPPLSQKAWLAERLLVYLIIVAQQK